MVAMIGVAALGILRADGGARMSLSVWAPIPRRGVFSEAAVEFFEDVHAVDDLGKAGFGAAASAVIASLDELAWIRFAVCDFRRRS